MNKMKTAYRALFAGLCLSLIPTLGAFAEEPSKLGITVESVISGRYVTHYEQSPLGWIDILRTALPFNVTTVSMETPDGVGVSASAYLVYEYGVSSAHNIPIGFAGNPVLVENNMLSEGILFFPFFDGKVKIGRQDLSYGPSQLSNLQVTQAVPYLDAVSYELPLGSLAISQVVATLENRRGLSEVPIINTNSGSHPYTDDAEGYVYGETIILLSSRRFSYTTRAFELGVGAILLASRRFNAFQLGDVLPIFSVHNADVGFHNFSLYLDGACTAIENHTQYAIIGLDDFNANSVGISDVGVPTIWAFVLGARGRFEIGDSLAIGYEVEGTATHYLWGSFHESYYLSRAIYRLKSDSGFITIPLTSPFGPARASAECKVRVELPISLSLKLDGLLVYGDPSINLYTTAYAEGAASYGFMLARVEASLEKTLFKNLTLYAGGGADVLPAAVTPRLTVGGSWRFSNARR